MNEPAQVIRIRNGVVQSNSYVVRLDRSGSCVLIDPGLDADAIQSTLDEAHLSPSAIYCTHGHFDHIGSAAHFQREFDIPVYLHPADVRLARASNFLLAAMKIATRIVVPDTTAYSPGPKGGGGPHVIPVPGHTPGSVVVQFGNHAFTGDTVYRNGLFRMRWPEEDEEALTGSLRLLWDDMPNDTRVHPGHGSGAAFGDIKRTNMPVRQLLGIDELAGI